MLLGTMPATVTGAACVALGVADLETSAAFDIDPGPFTVAGAHVGHRERVAS